MGFSWDLNGILMGFPWDSHGILMGFIELTMNFDVMSMFGNFWNLDTRFDLDFGGILRSIIVCSFNRMGTCIIFN